MSDDLVSRLLNLGPDDSGFRQVGVAAATALTEARAEIERLTKRLDLLAVVFSVPDGGRYLADWQTRISKFKAAESELATLRARVREVVGPFANLAQRYDDTVGDGWISWAEFVADHAWPTETNCRAARQVMEDLTFGKQVERDNP